MYKIATLNKISPIGLGKFTDAYTVIDDINDADGIILRSYALHDTEFSDSLLAIGRAGAGTNNIPVDRCAEEGIVVFNTPGANANAVKELTLAGLLLAARNITAGFEWAKTLDGDVSKKVEKGKSQFTGTEIKGKTLGVIGLGAIGVTVANAASELGMNVIGYDPYITLTYAHALYSTIPVENDLGTLLPKCDFISIHVPANDSTKGMIDSRRFSQMKDGAVFLNFARDKLVNDKALAGALESGKLKAYVTDFPNSDVLGLKGVIALPHLGASTAEAEDNCAVMAAEELMEFIERGNVVNSVNFPSCSLGALCPDTVRICVLNRNVPSVLGNITSHLAELNLNIVDLTNKSKGDYAVSLMDIEGEADDEAIRAALDFEGIIRVRIIR